MKHYWCAILPQPHELYIITMHADKFRAIIIGLTTVAQHAVVEQTCPCCRSDNYNITERLVERHNAGPDSKHKDEGCA